eukprot:3196030-Pleurochrysis_carterae.AAC.1
MRLDALHQKLILLYRALCLATSLRFASKASSFACLRTGSTCFNSSCFLRTRFGAFHRSASSTVSALAAAAAARCRASCKALASALGAQS